jgi:alpha-1,3-rhamnosyl/mannosyltransferase
VSSQPSSEPRLRVAINGTALLSQLTGIGQYTKSLAEQLQATGELDLQVFYAASWSPDIRTGPAKHIGPLKALIKKVVPNAYGVSRRLQQWRFNLGARALTPQLYHEPNFLPFRFSGPTVITAHDLSWIRYPETHPAQRVEIMNRFFPRALERAAHVITDAAFTRREIIDDFGIAPERVTSIPLGARAIFQPRAAEELQATLAAYELTYRSYVLCVGTLEPRKNLELVLRAYAGMPKRFREKIPLVTVGMKGWLTSRLEAVMQPLVAGGELKPLGYTTDEALAALYAGAMVLVYPSLYEGFGLPPLEAMASGTPVIVSNRSTLPEVVGDAGIVIDAADDLALRRALERLESDPAWWQERAKASLNQAARFSWARCASETLGIYRQVLAQT